MNSENFFDDVDAPPPVDDDVQSTNQYQAKLARVAGALRDRLHFPDMVAMQEVENTHVLDDLLARPELRGQGYKYVLLPTNGHRSINPALIYKAGEVSVSNVRQLQKMVDPDHSPISATGGPAVAGAAPPDPNAPQPLFAREPLAIDVAVKGSQPGQEQDFTLVVNHLISKYSPHGLPTDPIRIQQAKFLNSWVSDLRKQDPTREVMVVGDMNDTPDSKALHALTGPASHPTLTSVLNGVPRGERYTFNEDGQCDLIDQIMTTPGLASEVERVGVRHYNSDMPGIEGYASGPTRASDHDPPYAVFAFPNSQ
jgi:predicted extracellular nuclease